MQLAVDPNRVLTCRQLLWFFVSFLFHFVVSLLVISRSLYVNNHRKDQRMSVYGLTAHCMDT